MRGYLAKIGVSLLVVTLATPASLAFAAGPSDDDKKAPARPVLAAAPDSTATAIVRTSATGLTGSQWRAAVTRAAAATAADPQVKRAASRAGSPARAQYGGGGGGKGAMVMTLVTTVVSLGLTYYMIKYLRDQQNANDEGE